MEVFADWKFYLFIMAIINMAVTLISFISIKFNDLKHLGEDVKELKVDLKKNTSKVTSIDKALAVQKQRIDALENSTR